MINPVVLILVYTFVFSFILKVKFHQDAGPLDFPLYLICGMVPWFAVQESLTRAAGCIEENADLVRKVNFPASLIPIHIVVGNIITMTIGLVVFIVFAAAVKGVVSKWLPLIPVVIALQTMLTLGLAWLFACMNVVLRDTRQLVSSGLLIWMFVTPVCYPSALIPKQYNLVLVLNPFAHLVDLYREIILKSGFPGHNFVSLLVSSIVIFAAGYFAFVRMQPRFVDLI